MTWPYTDGSFFRYGDNPSRNLETTIYRPQRKLSRQSGSCCPQQLNGHPNSHLLKLNVVQKPEEGLSSKQVINIAILIIPS